MNWKWRGLRKIIMNLKTANLCAEIQIGDLQIMNRIPNYLTEMFLNRSVWVKMPINFKYMEINSMGKYLDF
jgi:hypothetical protein